MRQVGLDIDRDAVERHPAPQPHADGGDLVLTVRALVRPAHPDADPVLAPFAAHVEGRQCPDDPLLEAGHIGAHVGPPPLQVEHHIGHPLAGAVIGELAATPGGKDRKAGVQQVGGLAAGAGGVERRDAPAARPVPALAGRDRSPRALPWRRRPRDRAPARPRSPIPPRLRRRGAQRSLNRGFGGH